MLRAQFRSDGCGCPIPNGDTGGSFGRRIPAHGDSFQQLSADGKTLAYMRNQSAAAYLLDLSTLKQTKIVVHGDLPGEKDIGYGDLYWCPHDPDLLIIGVSSFVDTTNSGHSDVSVSNLFTYRVSTGQSVRITPAICGKYGPTSIAFYSWLWGSSEGSDSLLVGFHIPQSKAVFYGVYIPQTKALLPHWLNPQVGITESTIIALTKDRTRSITAFRDTSWPPVDSAWWNLDTSTISCPRIIQVMDDVSFSPNGRLLALTVEPFGTGPAVGGDTIFPQVWIFSSDSARPTTVQIINFQCLYCKYNFWGADAIFVTDSTLVVSMHSDGDSTSPLYEITLSGRIVRQLTWLPQQGVVASSALPPDIGSDFLHPTVASDRIVVDIPATSVRAEVTLSDVLGRELSRRSVVAHSESTEFETTNLPNGSYFCRVASTEGTRTEKFIVRH